jgi:hypothetical protein
MPYSFTSSQGDPGRAARDLRRVWDDVVSRPRLWLGFGVFQFWLVTLLSDSWLFPVTQTNAAGAFPTHDVPLTVCLLVTAVATLLYRKTPSSA